MFEDWVVENNVVFVDHWHGITLSGAVDSRIVNNTVCDINSESPGPSWIRIGDHKNGTPSSGCVVRNNLTTALSSLKTTILSSIGENIRTSSLTRIHLIFTSNRDARQSMPVPALWPLQSTKMAATDRQGQGGTSAPTNFAVPV